MSISVTHLLLEIQRFGVKAKKCIFLYVLPFLIQLKTVLHSLKKISYPESKNQDEFYNLIHNSQNMITSEDCSEGFKNTCSNCDKLLKEKRVFDDNKYFYLIVATSLIYISF